MDNAAGRVTGFEVLPLAKLGRPRIDVTFRISGFFRDAFPTQIELLDSAMRAVMTLDETGDDNPWLHAFTRNARASSPRDMAVRMRSGAHRFASSARSRAPMARDCRR